MVKHTADYTSRRQQQRRSLGVVFLLSWKNALAPFDPKWKYDPTYRPPHCVHQHLYVCRLIVGIWSCLLWLDKGVDESCETLKMALTHTKNTSYSHFKWQDCLFCQATLLFSKCCLSWFTIISIMEIHRDQPSIVLCEWVTVSATIWIFDPSFVYRYALVQY